MRPASIILSIFALLSLHVGSHAQIITTYAGNGILGLSGDSVLATDAEMPGARGLNIDLNGDLQIAEAGWIRKVDKNTHYIYVIAGSDTATNLGGNGDGGPALEALMVKPAAICNDEHGNFYIADYTLNEVRKVDISTGIIDTFAGCRQIGNTGDNIDAKRAKFSGPFSICIDTVHHYMYISISFNYRVRRVDMQTNIITAFAGTGTNGYSGDGGPALNADFSRVVGVCLDKDGNVYIGDWDNARIRKVDYNTGIVTTIAGTGTLGYSGDGGLATNAMITAASAMCFDKFGDLYFTDEPNHRVRKINMSTGIITTVAGNGVAGFSGDGGLAVNASLQFPRGVCIDSSMNLYISDFDNHRIRKVNLPNTHETESVGNVMARSMLNIYPNPATDHLNIELKENWQDATLSIISLQGQELMQAQCKPSTTQLNTQALPAGTYFIKIADLQNGQTLVQPLLKQ